jgi:hypothetical protein
MMGRVTRLQIASSQSKNTRSSRDESQGTGMSRREPGAGRDLVSASEIASYVYCPEQWRLQFGKGHGSENVEALARGARFHRKRAATMPPTPPQTPPIPRGARFHRERAASTKFAVQGRSTGCLVVILTVVVGSVLLASIPL